MLDLKERINCFQLVLYENSDTLNFNEIIEKIKSCDFYSCKWYYCKHNKDVNENGEIKKIHYHLVVKLDTNIAIDKILKCLDNGKNYITLSNTLSIVKSLKGCVRYLIHKDNSEKYQYQLSDIKTNDKNLSYYFNDNNILDNFNLIVNIIKNNNISTFKDLIYFCVNNNQICALQYIQDNAYLVSCLFR